MACNASQVLADGIAFYGLSTPQLKGVQLQIAAEALLQLSPATDVSAAGLLDRAEASGFCCLTRKELRNVTAQLLCDIRESI